MSNGNGRKRAADEPTVGQKMLDLLADGLPHTRRELHDCLWDTSSPFTNVHAHLSALRAVLRPQGKDIICQQIGHALRYRLVRLVGTGGE